MPFALLDDKFHSHPKFVTAGLAARGLYTSALSYCADWLTDGFLSTEIAEALAGREKTVIRKLTKVGAWTAVKEGEIYDVHTPRNGVVEVVMPTDGFFIEDYLQYNPPRAIVRRKRAEAQAAGRRGAEKRWGTHDPTQSPSHSEPHSGSHSEPYGEPHSELDGVEIATRAHGVTQYPVPHREQAVDTATTAPAPEPSRAKTERVRGGELEQLGGAFDDELAFLRPPPKGEAA